MQLLHVANRATVMESGKLATMNNYIAAMFKTFPTEEKL